MAKKRKDSTLYRVQPSDCLFAIAQKLLGSGDRYPEIKALNGMTTDILLPGQRIRIPTDSSYAVGADQEILAQQHGREEKSVDSGDGENG